MIEIIETLNKVHWIDSLDSPHPFRDLPIEYSVKSLKTGSLPEGSFLKQVHGDRIIDADKYPVAELQGQLPGDGLICHQPEKQINVRTADCLPLLLTDRLGRTIMALHCGWRSLTQGLLQKGINILKKEFPVNELYLFMGPCIGLRSFEVGPDVLEAVRAMNLPENQLFLALQKGARDRWHIDLSQVALIVALEQGVLPDQITVLRSCTFEQDKLWHSYRREKELSGYIWTSIKKKISNIS